ncbi:hypothetical protein [Streptomyces mirabilis]|uniref:hypothetical protein n=1 Tax=Streptomyces mirabilis TaxID=68239 RepID=UPI0033BA2EC6
MDLSGIAALCALAGIPVTVLLAQWQKRTALRQSEASHQTAMAQAEASHRTAMAQAEASHRTALEVAEASHRNALEAAERAHQHALELAHQQEQARLERLRSQKRYTVYAHFQSALDQFRLILFNDPTDLFTGWQQVHQAGHRLSMSGTGLETNRIAADLVSECTSMEYMDTQGTSTQELQDRWRARVSPLRTAFDAAVRREYDLALGRPSP